MVNVKYVNIIILYGIIIVFSIMIFLVVLITIKDNVLLVLRVTSYIMEDVFRKIKKDVFLMNLVNVLGVKKIINVLVLIMNVNVNSLQYQIVL